MGWYTKIRVTVASLAIGGATTGLTAGPLDPPAGPVAPTGKTLSEVEPRTPVETLAGDASSQYIISQSGSYYLTGNLTGVSGKVGIRITASNVTLDLRGFALIGVGGSSHGIYIASTNLNNPLRNIKVHDGVIRGWGGSGVRAGSIGFLVQNSSFEDLLVSFNAGYGIRPAAGGGVTVRDCNARNNILGGIDLGVTSLVSAPNSIVSRCTATSNSGAGIRVAEGSIVVACAAKGNTTGISAGPGCSIIDCTADANTGVGIDAADGCAVVACTTVDNTDRGIQTGNGCAIASCTLRRNGLQAGPPGTTETGGCAIADCAADATQTLGLSGARGSAITRCQAVVGRGIFAQDGSVVSDCVVTSTSGFGLGENCVAVRCTASNSTTTGLSTGAGEIADFAGDGSLVADCTAFLSAINGFHLDAGALVIGCESTGNGSTTTWGISASGWSYLLGNRCRGNIDGIGFILDDSRFEANHVLFNGTGFDFTGFAADNLFVRNSSTSNPAAHYDVPPGNRPLTVTNNPTTAKAWDNFSTP